MKASRRSPMDHARAQDRHGAGGVQPGQDFLLEALPYLTQPLEHLGLVGPGVVHLHAPLRPPAQQRPHYRHLRDAGMVGLERLAGLVPELMLLGQEEIPVADLLQTSSSRRSRKRPPGQSTPGRLATFWA